MVGSVLGHYKILRLVGKGGMGEVYAAEDLTLGRTVAIKVLPPDVQNQPAELERFAREAKSIAALNHRGIVTLHSFEESAGTHFITMELVEGVPLSSKIIGKGLPFADVLRIGIEMADAVAVAHERGIIHRDLKPANVLVRPDGQVKILDFGLAKLREAETSAAELPTQQLTGEGKIVGTVAYMSPEQAEGRPVDHRTDIFSLGVVLYELATGERPFKGDTSMSVLSAVLREQPKSASDLNPAIPSPFARVLKICLQKDPERRYQSAKDLRNELQTLKEELDSGELNRPVVPTPAVGGEVFWKKAMVGFALILPVVLVVIALVYWLDGSSDEPAPLVTQHTRLTSASGIEGSPTLSPDGKWFLYVSQASGNWDIYLQSVGGQTGLNLTKESTAADLEPAFSPDGELIAFYSTRDGSGLYVMGRTGDAPRRITAEGRTPAWSPDGKQLVFATVTTDVPTSRGGLSELRTVRIDTGEVTTVTTLDALDPAWSPNAKFIAFWGMGRTPGGTDFTSSRDIWVVNATGGAPWQVTSDAHVDWCPMWTPDGSFLYFLSNRGGSMNLWRIAMDPDTGRAAGSPQAVTTPAGYVGRAKLSRSGGGLVFEARETSSNIHRSTFDAVRGAIGAPVEVTSGSRTFRFVDLSPNGQLLVLGTSYLQQEDLFVSKADGSELRQLTTDAFNDRLPEWSPDGSLIAFYSDRNGKYEIWTATPAGQLRQITDTAEFSALYPRWSPSGKRMTFSDISTRRAVVIFDPHTPWKNQTPDVLPPPAGAGTYLAGQGPRWSPDETRLAGTVNGVVTIYDIATRKYRSLAGVSGAVFAWLKDGRLLIGPSNALRLVDAVTGAVRNVTMPAFGGLIPGEYRITRDEHSLYFPLMTAQSDIWLVTLEQKK
jgi:serine/threonine protein kinase